MQIQTTADQLIYSTMRLTALSNGVEIGTGTGFFFSFDFDGHPMDVIITNKHVVEGADAVRLRLHMRDSAGQFLSEGYPFTIKFGHVIGHPDPEVDLCVIGVGAMTTLQKDGRRAFAVSLSADNIPTDQDWESFDSVEGVWMVGCPNGLYDTMNNLPIVRSGITASSPRLHYRGKQEFVVDMACFPGSSGSPIFRAPSVARFDRSSGANTFGRGDTGFLLGVLYAGPMITNEGEIVLSTKPRVEVSSMMHLGYAIRSNRILDFKALIEPLIGK